MIGGSESVVETVKPLFQLMGKNITYMGSSGMGQHTKMVNQILSNHPVFDYSIYNDDWNV